jgi:hypothetical protein
LALKQFYIKNVGPAKIQRAQQKFWVLDLCPAKWKQILKSVHDRYIFKIKNARSIKLWPLIIFFSFDIRDFPGIFIMAHQHKILWAINSAWGSLRTLVGSRGNAPVEGKGSGKDHSPKMGFRPLWKPFPVILYIIT